jgi:hypothetical protein
MKLVDAFLFDLRRRRVGLLVRRQIASSDRNLRDLDDKRRELECEATAFAAYMATLGAVDRVPQMSELLARGHALAAETQHVLDQRDELARQIDRIGDTDISTRPHEDKA